MNRGAFEQAYDDKNSQLLKNNRYIFKLNLLFIFLIHLI